MARPKIVNVLDRDRVSTQLWLANSELSDLLILLQKNLGSSHQASKKMRTICNKLKELNEIIEYS